MSVIRAARRPVMARVSVAVVMEELPIRMAVRASRPAMLPARLTAAGGGVAAVVAVAAGGADGGF
jgi:hypothetical protein